MSLWVILLIMLFSGIIGGSINYLLAANKDPVTGKEIQSVGRCILIGIGATILIPLFLEIAQSNLLNNIKCGWIECPSPKDTDNTLKNYLLFLAYCFMAAAAGPRFITSLTDSVLKDKKIDALKQQNAQINEEKDQVVEEKNVIEKKQELQTVENRVRAVQDESKVSFIAANITDPGSKSPKPLIGPVTVADDPQKGRFGGRSVVNERELKATVEKSNIPEFYNVTIWVESTNPSKPMDSDVVFYLHDSFRPSVYTITTEEFEDGKAMDKGILSYGAFTVGAVADNGNTLLELDLAENSGFPEKFRSR